MSALFRAAVRPERPLLRLTAQGLGLTCVLLAVIGVVLANLSWTECGYSVVIFVFTIPLAMAAVILGYIARTPLAYRSSGVALLVALYMFVYGYGFPPCGERVASNETSAVGSMRTLNTALARYRDAHPEKGYASDFYELVRDQAGYIDPVLAVGQKSGYHFMYQPGPTDSDGRIRSYELTACPIDYANDSWRSFFCDETGVIRHTTEYRPATRSDPRMD